MNAIIIDKSSGKPIEINPEGSLGLLALGATGLEAWRKAREKASKNRSENNPHNLQAEENRK